MTPTILYAIYAILIIGPIYLVWAIYKINKKMRKAEWMATQDYSVLRIDVPRNNDKSPQAAEQMFAAIHGIYSSSAEFQNHISFEIVAKDKYIQFFVYLPSHLKDFVEGQIYAQYPNVEINVVNDYVADIDLLSRNYAICELSLNKPDVYPIKQFTDFGVDPISGVTSVMSKLEPNEEVWFQMVVKPIGDNWQEKGHSMVTTVRTGFKPMGKDVASMIKRGLATVIRAFVISLFKPGDDWSNNKKEIKLHASVESALKGIEDKITKLGFETKIRIISLSNDSISARLKCQNIAAAFKQFNTTNLNGFRISDIYINDQTRWKDYIYRSFEDNGNIFNISELASIYHFPHMNVATPNIVWSGSKKGEPPANLPLRENTPDADLTVIGETNFRNVFKVFGIKRDDRRRHMYIVGKSGVGKSVLIENMAINDVVSGRGVIIVDPHGELADKILSCIPDHRIDDVVVFDPADREYPVAFNLLENVDDDFKSIVASGFVGIFKKMFQDSWGPRLEHILRNTVLALLDYPESTMLDIPRMLTNNRFRDKVMEKIKDPIIREFWKNEFASFDTKFRTEAVAPILNKVGQFLASSTIRNIVGQPHSSVNIRDIMDQQKIMIVNLSRGKIGEDNSALLGAMMITKIQLAAMSRADTTIDQRPDSYLYVDEFQNFATDAFAVILAEARKYNLNLTMAHQYIAQLKEEVKDAVFGNAGTIISFRVGGADAEALVKEYEPVFTANDLVNLDKYHIYIKLLVDGISAPAFSARTLAPVSRLTGNIEKVLTQSRNKYSNLRKDVEGTIADTSRQEENEMLADAAAFKKGGLEALLVKKPATAAFEPREPRREIRQEPVQKIVPKSEPVVSEPIKHESIKQVERVAEAPAVQHRAEPTNVPVLKDTEKIERTEPVAQVGEKFETIESLVEPSGIEEKAKSKSKVVKYNNIINGKLYKERTARGGVKWFLGEEIDEEKLAKSGIIIDDGARRMIELSKKVGTNNAHKSNHKQPDKNNQHNTNHKNSEPKKSHNESKDVSPTGDREAIAEQPRENISVKKDIEDKPEVLSAKLEPVVLPDDNQKPQQATSNTNQPPIVSNANDLEEGQAVKLN